MIFVIPGDPIAKARHRTFTRNGVVRAYDPQNSEKKKVQAQLLCQLNLSLNHQDCQIAKKAASLADNCAKEVELTFYMPVPKSDSEATRNAKLWGFDYHIVKPDLDNLEKFYLDCGNGIIYPDDRLIASVRKKKLYSKNPRTEIKVYQKVQHEITPKTQMVLRMFGPSKLEDFLQDAIQFTKLRHTNYDELSDGEKHLFLNEAANMLSNFAEKWHSELGKIKKKISKEEVEQFTFFKTGSSKVTKLGDLL